MHTIKIYLKPSGRFAELYKDFPIFKNAYQNKLVDVYVPKSVLFANEQGTFTNAVKMAGILTAETGAEVTTDSYYLDYLKDVTINNVEYAVYERVLPKELTVFAGSHTIVVNVLSIDDTDTSIPAFIQVVTTQTTNLLVQNSAYIGDATETEVSKDEQIIAGISTNRQNISDLQGRTATLETQTAENTQNIAKNRNDIDIIKQAVGTGEDFIGTLVVDSVPTEEVLNNFVEQEKSRIPKLGDSVIVTLQIAGDTDKNYKYIYNGRKWTYYEIPPIELSSNGTHGLIEGTFGVGLDYNTLVDVSGGQIRNIYIKGNDGNYRNLQDYVNVNSQDIEDIINGDTVVGEAMKAVEDGFGNNIANTYLTQVLGATKQFVRDYAQPREFGNVYFISANGYTLNIPTTPENGVQFTTTTSDVGSYQIFQLSKTNRASFDLTSINGYANNIYISASENCSVQFRLTTEYRKQGGDWTYLNVELSNMLSMIAGDIQRVQLNSPFTALGDSVLTLTENDEIRQTLEVVTQASTLTEFKLFSNEIYPSTFSITSQSYILEDIDKVKSQIIQIGANGIVEANRVVMTVEDADSFVEYRTNQREFLVNGHIPVVGVIDESYPLNIEFGDTVYNVYSFEKGGDNPLTFGDIASVTTYNSNVGYTFNARMFFVETSDIVGFVLSPSTITAEQVYNLLGDDGSVLGSVTGSKLNLMLANELQNKINRALVTPISAPSSGTYEIPAINDTNSQINLQLGDGLYVENGKLNAQATGEVDVPVTSVNGQTGDVNLTAGDVDALPNTIKYASNLSLTIDNSTYVVTAQLKDQDGNNLGTAQTIDLPLESVVVSGDYDEATKEVVLTLKDGSSVKFSVADLVSGLASSSDIPTKTSQLTNDSGFLTSAPVTSVNGMTGAVTGLVTTNTAQTITGAKAFTGQVGNMQTEAGVYLGLDQNTGAENANIAITSANTAAYIDMGRPDVDYDFRIIKWNQADNKHAQLVYGGNASGTITIPQAFGTMALTSDLANYFPLSGGAIGANGIQWEDASLPQDTAPQFICTIDAFAAGGRQKWASLADLKTQLGVPTDYATVQVYSSEAEALAASQANPNKICLY